MTNKFNRAENQVLTEIYRRLNYFHNGNVNADLLLLALPSSAKVLSKYNLITISSGREIPKAFNWYKLTETGKKFFKPYATTKKLSESENSDLYSGKKTIQFSK